MLSSRVLFLLIISVAPAVSRADTPPAPPAPLTPPPAPVRFHPNAHGAHRPSADLSTADGLGFSLNIPYESILYYRGTRAGENGVPLSLDMDVRITDTLTWVNHYRFINFIDDNSADSKVHLWTALMHEAGRLSIGPSLKYHRNNSAGSSIRDASDLGIQALYDFGPVKAGIGYAYELESEGSYLEAGLSCPLKLTPKFTLTPAAEITWIDGWVRPVTGLNNIAIRVTGTWKFNPHCAVAPFVAYNIPLEATKDLYSEEFIIGGALHLKF